MLWAALLAGIAGYVDAICYLRLGHAFAANMTGNLVEAGMRAAAGDWTNAAWYASLLLAFLIGTLLARGLLRAHVPARGALLFEAAIIAAAASGRLGPAAAPVLGAAMAIQNQAAKHSILEVNVGFVTGDIQGLGEYLVPGTAPKPQRHAGQPRIILIVLVFYAIGAALGAIGSAWGVAALGFAGAATAGAALLPVNWAGRAAERH